jgi:hypothetical protein
MNINNEPLMFIDTIQKMNNNSVSINYRYSVNNIKEHDKKIKKLVNFYNKNRRIIIEIIFNNEKKKGTIINYKDNVIYLKNDEDLYHINLKDIKIIKILEL